MQRTLTWLHISDLHVGSTGFADHWKTAEAMLLQDLSTVLGRTGTTLDLVVFTGDLTQSASADQFAALETFLLRLWKRFAELECMPALVAVPGNHDLVRPKDDGDPDLTLIRHSWGAAKVRDDFWGARSAYSPRDKIVSAFGNYADWWATTRLPKLPHHAGMLPGDISSTLTLGNVRLGILGLNSAYLHLGDDVREDGGRLDLTMSQFNAACGGNGPQWVEEHDLCMLLTHHPLTWLAKGGEDFVDDVCNGPDRFQFHLFGHMHALAHASTARGWDDFRTSIQAASLFSKEKFGPDLREQRLVGYNVGVLRRRGTQYEYSMWPRQLQRIDGGRNLLGPASGVRYRADGSEGTHWRVVPTRLRKSNASSRLIDILESYREIGAFAGPKSYAEVHTALGAWFKRHADRGGPLHVRNIAFDMQHTWPFIEGLLDNDWKNLITWQTLLMDHTSGVLAQALREDTSIRGDTARASEENIRAFMRRSRKVSAATNVKFAAVAYSEIPTMHGFMINDELLIAAFCMHTGTTIMSSPYFIFVEDGGAMNFDGDVVQRTMAMFKSWFERNWKAGRKIPGSRAVVPSKVGAGASPRPTKKHAGPDGVDANHGEG